jgi:four helix bundle protein
MCHDCIKNFPKQEKYSLGFKIESTVLEILELLLAAAYGFRNEKLQKVRIASNKTDLLKLLIRLSYDTKSINTKQYLTLQEQTVEIGKMLGGWIKSLS